MNEIDIVIEVTHIIFSVLILKVKYIYFLQGRIKDFKEFSYLINSDYKRIFNYIIVFKLNSIYLKYVGINYVDNIQACAKEFEYIIVYGFELLKMYLVMCYLIFI